MSEKRAYVLTLIISAVGAVAAVIPVYCDMRSELSHSNSERQELTRLVRELQQDRRGLVRSVEEARLDIIEHQRTVDAQAEKAVLEFDRAQQEIAAAQRRTAEVADEINRLKHSAATADELIAHAKAHIERQRDAMKSELAALQDRAADEVRGLKRDLDELVAETKASRAEQRQDLMELREAVASRADAEIAARIAKEDRQRVTAERTAKLDRLSGDLRRDLIPLTDRGFYRRGNFEFAEQKPLALSDLAVAGALEKTPRGLAALAELVMNPQNDRSGKWARHQYIHYTGDQKVRMGRVQASLRDLGDVMVEEGWLSP